MPQRIVARSGIPILAMAALLSGCASDGTSPDPSGRNLGILQMSAAGNGAAMQASEGEGSAGSDVSTSISWDLPPGEGVLFPPEVIQTPSAVMAGYPFRLSVFTVGPNGCWSPDGIDVEIGTGVVELTPWDLHSGADACTMIFGYLGHEADITLPAPGEWTLRVEGRRIRGDGTVDGSVKAERKIMAYLPSTMPIPAEVTLAPGEDITVAGLFRIDFDGVAGDSRCPVDVQCVWQGNAAVRLHFEGTGTPRTSILLNTGIEPGSVEIGGFRIELLGLSPAPLSTSAIPSSSYRATLGVERLPTP